MTAPDVAVATHLVEVEFKGNRRAFYEWTGESPPPVRAAVIVKVERGEDLARIHSIGELAEKRRAGTSHGLASPSTLPAVVRLATKHEIETATLLRVDEESVRKAALEIVRELKLDMKVSDAEWQWDRRRLTCYFTAEERVDFRHLVRQLERRFSTRVHMWHIGVRDEARRLDGIGRCGRQYCSSSWLPELRPVKSSSAKDQRLSTLNPAQISGTCGRLMCCLRHEHEFYVQARKRFPKEGKVLTIGDVEEKVVGNDIFRDQVTLRNIEGELRTIPLAQLRRELGEVSAAVEDPAPPPRPPARRPPDGREVVDLKRAKRAVAQQPAQQPEPESADSVAEPDDIATSDAADSGDVDTSPAQSSADSRKRGRRRRGRRGGRRAGGKDENRPPGSDAPPSAPSES